MQTLDFNPDDFLPQNQSAADKTLWVKFDMRPKQDPIATLEQGKPVFKDVLYIDIRAPGSKDSVCRPASQQDVQRFAEHYRAFKDRTNVEGLVGTPLSEWPLITRSQAEEMAFHKIKTVEQLADIADTHSGLFMNFYSMKQKAKDWLAVAKEQNAALHLQAKLNAQNEQMAAMQEQINQLLAGTQVTPITAAVKEVIKPANKGGRPRKFTDPNA